MRQKSNLNSLIAALILILGIPFLAPQAATCYGQGLGLGQQDLIRQLRDTGAAMKEYGRTHDHFPSNVSEFDDCLKMLFKKVSLTMPDTTVYIQTSGKFRTYYQFAIAVDPSFMAIPIVNGIPQVPDSYTAPPSTVVILTDGGANCVGWVAGEDGKPVVLQGGPIGFDETIKAKDAPKDTPSSSSVTTSP